jgi:hypothetical protein
MRCDNLLFTEAIRVVFARTFRVMGLRNPLGLYIALRGKRDTHTALVPRQ